MAIILDADVIIGGEKGTFNLQQWVATRPDEQFEMAAVTVAELWHGVERATGAHQAKRQAIRLLNAKSGSAFCFGWPYLKDKDMAGC